MTEQTRTRIIIDADSPQTPIHLGVLWQFRELMFFLMWREWSVRYKQTAFGVGWVILQPIATAAMFSVIFGLFLNAPSNGLPFPVFFLCGLIPWRFYSDGVMRAANSIVMNTHLVEKVYFPRLILPISGVLTPLADFVVAFGVLLATILLFGLNPFSVRWIFLPVFLLLALLTSTGIGLLFAAMNVRYRDVGQFLPFILQIWMYGSPILYPISVVQDTLPAWMIDIYRVNPMVTIVQGFRWALVDSPPPDWQFMAISTVLMLLMLVFGLLYFNATERTFGDII